MLNNLINPLNNSALSENKCMYCIGNSSNPRAKHKEPELLFLKSGNASYVKIICCYVTISYRSVIEFTRSLDPARPVTFVTKASAETDHAVSS